MKNQLIAVLLICISFTLQAQSYDSTFLVEKIDSLIAKLPSSAPGGAIAVVSSQKIIYEKSFGMMNLEYQLPNTKHTLFNIASVSKHFTAYCILLLEKEGKINLDDDIRSYLPSLPKYSHKISIRHLIHHTSGIASSDNLRLFAGLSLEAPWDAQDEMNIISRYDQLNYRPNDESFYSNSGYFLLAKIIEKVSGQSFCDYITEKLFLPLGMNETIVYDSPGKIIMGKAAGYKQMQQSFVRMNTEGESVYGSTNIYTSINDLVIWAKYLLNPTEDHKQMVSRLFVPSHVTNKGYILNYTYGLNIENYKGMKMADHSGYAMGFRSRLIIFPENDVAIIAMCNNESIDPEVLTTTVADWHFNINFVSETKTQRKEVKIPAKVLNKYTGVYKMTDGRELSFEIKNDTFLVNLPGEEKHIMCAESETDFYVKEFDAECRFQIGNNGECYEMVWRQQNKKPRGLKVGESISTSVLQKYEGNYFNDPLDITYPVKLKNNRLYMVIPKSFEIFFGIDKEVQLEYLGKDKFLTHMFGIVQFTRNSNHEIIGFRIVDFGRVKNIQFKKKVS